MGSQISMWLSQYPHCPGILGENPSSQQDAVCFEVEVYANTQFIACCL